MFVTDIRKEFYEIVANQVRTSLLASPGLLTSVEYLDTENYWYDSKFCIAIPKHDLCHSVF